MCLGGATRIENHAITTENLSGKAGKCHAEFLRQTEERKEGQPWCRAGETGHGTQAALDQEEHAGSSPSQTVEVLSDSNLRMFVGSGGLCE